MPDGAKIEMERKGGRGRMEGGTEGWRDREREEKIKS